MTIIEITVIVGCVLIGIFVYYLYLSTLILRIRLDSRGLLFTMGKSLKTKIAWQDVTSARCYEREGGFTMSKTIRGLEIKGKHPSSSVIPIFSKNKDLLKMESDIWSQESLDKTVNVVRFYNKKFDFDASIDEWAQSGKFMFAPSDSK